MNQLANDDVWLVIFSHLNNDELSVIAQTDLWSTLRQVLSSNVFWYRRCRVLTGLHINFVPSPSWQDAYNLLNGSTVTESAVSLLLLTVTDLDWNSLLCRSIVDANVAATRLLLADSRADPLSLPMGILTFSDVSDSSQALAATYVVLDERIRQSNSVLSVLASVIEEYCKTDSTIDVELFSRIPPTPEHMNSLILKHIRSKQVR